VKRQATIARRTKETQISATLDLDGTGVSEITTGIGFLDHMLEQMVRHGLLDLTLSARGDLDVDFHHTVEDVGICLGKGLRQALGDGTGIRRFGHAQVVMDESLVSVTLDVSGRPYLVCKLSCCGERAGAFPVELVQ